MTETAWVRLHRLVDKRRAVLGLTLHGVQGAGGPSPSWVQNLRDMSGAPSPRMRRSMRQLDGALRWPVDTTWGLVADDRSGWSEDVLADEEEQLMAATDEADRLGLVVAAAYRHASPEARAALRAEIVRMLAVPPLD